jgi:hypothetical protein
MVAPRIVKLTCPECGAALSVGTGSDVVTCHFCNKSAFVHWPNQPPPPRDTAPHYGNIHVSAEAMRATSALIVAFTVLPFVGIAVVGGVIAIVAAVATTSSSGTTSPTRNPQARMSTPGSPACERAVACCRALSPDSSACDGFRLMPDAQCVQQANQLAASVKSMGKTCK